MDKDIKELTNECLEKSVGGNNLLESEMTVPNSSIVDRAISELGKPYIWGGVGPSGYDDSGLVSYCLTGIHTRIGTTSTFMGWSRVNNPLPGDICVSSSHCGIYVEPNCMIHAPTYGTVVSYGPIQSDMIIVRYQCI